MSKESNKYAQRVRELGGRFYRLKEVLPPSLTEEKLSAVEAALGYPLPADYREFLRDFGEYKLEADYPLQNGPDGYKSSYVGIMFGVGGPDDIVRFHNDNLDNQVIPHDFLQLTRDEMGSIGLYLDGPRRGQVYLWYHAEVTAPYEYNNLYFIASSFDEFIQLLYPTPE